MPPALATLLTIVGVLFLLRRGIGADEIRSPALWLPVFWLAITGSRFLSQWINLEGWSAISDGEGSVIDVLYFLALIIAGFGVLLQRGVLVGEVIRNNKWLCALIIYGLISVAWSDFPFVAFKRWAKTLGHPLMVLIILTEPDAAAALRTVLKRCAYFLLPFSVLFIKYFPQYGRSFDQWSGAAINTGVGLTKNDLGYVCMVFGVFFAWNLLTVRRFANRKERLAEVGVSVGFIGIALWLLIVSDSKTSLATMLIAVSTMLALGWRVVDKRRIGTYVLILLATAFVLEWTFDIYAEMIGLLGRDPSLTDRTAVWSDVLALQDQPLFGVGFESFWLGPRLDILWAKWWWRPNQAHNGYIETYLNLGWVGVALLLGLLLSTFRKITRQLVTDFDFARLRFAFLLAIVAFNYTEAAFKAVHFIWTIFYVIAMEYPKRDLVAEQRRAPH